MKYFLKLTIFIFFLTWNLSLTGCTTSSITRFHSRLMRLVPKHFKPPLYKYIPEHLSSEPANELVRIDNPNTFFLQRIDNFDLSGIYGDFDFLARSYDGIFIAPGQHKVSYKYSYEVWVYGKEVIAHMHDALLIRTGCILEKRYGIDECTLNFEAGKINTYEIKAMLNNAGCKTEQTRPRYEEYDSGCLPP